MNLLRLVLFFASVLSVPVLAAQTRVATQIGFTGIHVAAVSTVNADVQALWATLTDYDHLANFVPGMTLSRVISAPGAPLKLVEQKGEGGLFSLILPDHVILSIDERPYSRIGFKSVSGWVTSMGGQWTITGNRTPVQLNYQVHVVPLLPPPPALTETYVQYEVGLRLEAVAREAERRMQASKK